MVMRFVTLASLEVFAMMIWGKGYVLTQQQHV